MCSCGSMHFSMSRSSWFYYHICIYNGIGNVFIFVIELSIVHAQQYNFMYMLKNKRVKWLTSILTRIRKDTIFEWHDTNTIVYDTMHTPNLIHFTKRKQIRRNRIYTPQIAIKPTYETMSGESSEPPLGRPLRAKFSEFFECLFGCP